ncbi:MAG: hypothetical protein IT443_00270 [Phycisphaeraceae bacterium]|nr:hypothetical protein [Phycisphaeraceae bacterium]
MIRSPVIVLALVMVCVVGLGFYRGWFSFSSTKTVETSNVTLTVDQDKMHQDKNQAIQTAQDLGHKVQNTVAPAPKKSDDPASPPQN